MGDRFYKWLLPDRMPAHGGAGQWPEPGTWAPPVDVQMCRSGYHMCRVEHLSRWIPLAPAELWTVDVRGVGRCASDKHAYPEARLVRRMEFVHNARELFAADYAARVLHIFEQACPGDDRPRKAIEARRLWADREIDAAAWAVARAAAGDAAGDAARAAALAGDAAWAVARAAAGDAAWAVAGDAARAAWAVARAAAGAGDAAWAAERLWQGQRILDYASGAPVAPWPLPEVV